MTGLLLNNERVDDQVEDQELQAHLKRHYESHKGKPATCLCQPVAPRMYIAKVGDRYILKRWPGSGHEHDVACERYEPPLEASGIGKLMGQAIDEDPNTGNVSLALGFSLKRSPRIIEDIKKIVEKGQEAEIHEGPAHQSNTKLSLRATLHYFWEGAKLNHWRPNMTGKRSWRFLYQTLKEYARHITSKGHVLANRLYIPEPFQAEDKERIRMRRRAFFQTVASNKPSRDLLIFLFEIKSLDVVDGGYAITAKNVPDDKFYLSEDTYKVVMARYGNEIAMFKREADRKPDPTDPPNHLVCLGTLSVRESGIATIEDLVVMMTTNNWIPINDATDEIMVKYATTERRQFMKPLRYNSGPGQPIASLIMLDTPERATSLWVFRPSDSEVLIERRTDALNSGRTNVSIIDLSKSDSITEIMDQIPRHAP